MVANTSGSTHCTLFLPALLSCFLLACDAQKDPLNADELTIDEDELILTSQGHMDNAEYQRQLTAGTEPCSELWLQMVEQKLPTGDGQGHGPDLGSSEWRSVVEFKLGIRGNPDVPDRDSEAWCTYIDQAISGTVR